MIWSLAQSGGRVDGQGVMATIAQGFFGADDKPGPCLFDGIEPFEIQIAAIHEVKGSRLVEQLVQPKVLRVGGQTDQHLRGQSRVQFQLGVEFEAGTFGVETRPRIDRQAQVDDARIQGINRLVQVQRQGLVGVKVAGPAKEILGHRGENAPVASGQRIGQCAASDRLAQAQVIALIAASIETGFDIAQAFAPGQLGKHQTDKLLPSGEVLDLVIATVALDAAAKLLWMDQIEQLGKDVLASEHDSRIAAKDSKTSRPNSSRSHPQIAFSTP